LDHHEGYARREVGQGIMKKGILGLLIAASASAAERPNVILIYTDDQGYGDASCLNPESKFSTPNLDRLAREGMTFTDGHCSDTVCTPSRYGLLTGRYSWRTTLKRGVMGAEGACLIADGRMTLPSLLRANGYATAMVGKWHLGMDFPGTKRKRDWTKPVQDMPLDKGFDYFWGIPASMNCGVLAWFEGRHAKIPPTQFTRKKPNRIAISDYRIMSPYESNPREPRDLEVAPDFVDVECLDRFTRKAIEWLRGKADAARKGKPFFLYLPYTSPHKPVIPIKRFRGKSKAGAYGDFMMETDWHVGRILKFLDDQKLAANTLVVFTSDNGPENTWAKRVELHDHRSNGIYREGKRSIYEGGHRVPFFVRWPAKVKGGSTWGEPVCQTDLLATFAEMVGAKLPDKAGEDSHSFYSALLGEKSETPRVPMIHHSSQGRFAIRDGKWKLVMPHAKKRAELYDLFVDPSEEKDLAKAHPEVVEGLTERITAIVRQGRSTEGSKQPNDTPPWSDLGWMKGVPKQRK
ncbi:MAG: arylsulfatase, partial [Opitutales bacterium]